MALACTPPPPFRQVLRSEALLRARSRLTDTRRATLSGYRKSCSQNRMTDHPCFRSFLVTDLSRAMFLSLFSSQNSELVEGLL